MKTTITLSTDFATSSPELNIIKHLISKEVGQNLDIVDFAHSNFHLNFFEVGIFVGHHFHLFEKGSIHILLCDIFNNYKGFFLLAQQDGHWFIAPDNGVLSVVNPSNIWNKIFRISLNDKIDLFSMIKECAVYIAKILEGSNEDEPKISDWQQFIIHRPLVNDWSIQGHFIYVDGFGNAVSNIAHSLFREMAKERGFKIFFGVTQEPISKLSTHYGSAEKGKMLARFNHLGLLEVAVNYGNASRLFGLKSIYSESLNVYHYHNIHIRFD